MDDLASVYERLIDMGFSGDSVDRAIRKGLYRFEGIFEDLVDAEESEKSQQKSTDHTATTGQSSQQGQQGPRLRWNPSSLIDSISTQENTGMDDEYRLDRLGNGNSNKVPSSTVSSSLIASSTLSDSTNRKMTKIQIMDLLDPSIEPLTYNHPFLSTICTIRDLICWFHKCRNSIGRISLPIDTSSCRLALSPDTSLHVLIDMFQQLKWHLVMPSGAQSKRIYGSDNLDKTLECLDLYPSAHLLAIISCPLELQKEIKPKHTKLLQMSSNLNNFIDPNAITNKDSNNCCVNIRMINYRNNPLYLQGNASYSHNYDPKKTTLQRIAVDFSCFCQMNLASFTLLQMQPRKRFSYPDDYLRTLSDLGLGGDVTLYCHSILPVATESNDNNSVSNNSNEVIMPNIDLFNPRTDIAAVTVHSRTETGVLPFSGVGVSLPGSYTSKTVAEIWTNKQLSLPGARVVSFDQSTIKNVPKSLYYLCFQEIYHSLKLYNSLVCQSVKKLPNNIQQTLIKHLIDEQLLTPSIIKFFCSPGTCLTTLDLSYTILATNEILKCVSRCLSLLELVLDNEEHVFSNEGLWHLRNCSNLRRLSLNYCSKINDWGIQVVGVLPALSVLAIKYTSVTNVGLKHIFLHLNTENESTSIPVLKSLDLSGLSISDECLSSIAIFRRLELLNLSSTNLTNPSLFPHLAELRHIDISNCQSLVWEKQAHIKSLSESFPKLSSINVRGVSNSNLVHVTMAISHCKNLSQIDGIFCHSQMTASLAASLSHLPLETIILTNCRHVTDLWLPVLARFSETLTHLVISSCPSITGQNNSLVNNLSRLRNLSWLDLTHLENVSGLQICQLILGQYFPKLQVVWISLTEAEEIQFRTASKNLHFKVNVSKSFVNSLESDLAANI